MVKAAHAIAEQWRSEVVRAKFHRNGTKNSSSLVCHCAYRSHQMGIGLENWVSLLQAKDVSRCAGRPSHHERHRWYLGGEYLLNAREGHQGVVAPCQRHEIIPSACVAIEPRYRFCQL